MARATRAARAAKPASTQEPRPRALFVLDAHTFQAMRQGEAPTTPYSHDRNVLLFAHVAIKRGVAAFVCCGAEDARARRLRQVRAIYPRWDFEIAIEPDIDAPAIAMVACAGIEALVLRATYPGAKLVGMLPALHMFEAPGLPPPRAVYDFLRALRGQVDFIVTQNRRMAETLAVLCHWLVRWQPGERLLVAPLGLSPDMQPRDEPRRAAARSSLRARMGLAPSDVLVVNAGGTWNWTDCDTYLEAACLHARAGGRVRSYFSGLTQDDNHEVNRVRDRILGLMREYPDCFAARIEDAGPIYVERDWARGGREVHGMLHAGDLGLSVSRDGFEGWQSHRVRVIDYVGAGLPLLGAGGDLLLDALCDPRLRATPGSVDGYRDILRSLEDGRLRDLGALRRRMASHARAALDGEAGYAEALDVILRTPARDPAEIAALEPDFLDLIEAQSDARLHQDVRGRLRALLAP